MRITGPYDLLIQYATAAYSAVSPAGSTTTRCCDPVQHEDGAWSIGCTVCLVSTVPLPSGLSRTS